MPSAAIEPQRKSCITATKPVSFSYVASERLASLSEDFRCMVNDAARSDGKPYRPKCGKAWDRDDLASKRIMACAVPQARPSRGSGEGEPRKQEDAGAPRSGRREG